MSNALIIAFFIGCFGFALSFLLYRFWSFAQLRQLSSRQGWTLVGVERRRWYWLGWLKPFERRVFAIEGEEWRYAAISRVTGVKVQASNDAVRTRLKRSARAVWSSPQGGSSRPVLLIPMQKGRHDPLNNPITRLLTKPGDLATEIAQLVAEDYPANEKLAVFEGKSIADYAVYTSDEATTKGFLETAEFGAVLAGWSNETERYARRPGILLYPGGVRLSKQYVEMRPKHVQRLIELGEELVRISSLVKVK